MYQRILMVLAGDPDRRGDAGQSRGNRRAEFPTDLAAVTSAKPRMLVRSGA